LPLTSERRCEFLSTQLRIAVPAAAREKLAGRDRDSAYAAGVDDMRHNLNRLRSEGAQGANFNVILPSDADAVVTVVGGLDAKI